MMGDQKYSITAWFKKGRESRKERFFGNSLEQCEERLDHWMERHPEWCLDYVE